MDFRAEKSKINNIAPMLLNYAKSYHLGNTVLLIRTFSKNRPSCLILSIGQNVWMFLYVIGKDFKLILPKKIDLKIGLSWSLCKGTKHFTNKSTGDIC